MSYFDTEVRRIWSPIDAPPDSLAGRRDDLDPVTIDNVETFEHFRLHGWMRVRAAFSADEASAMRDATCGAPVDAGITRSDPSTWTREVNCDRPAEPSLSGSRP
jgi:hypothetical protein